jgi:hypothetical protein
LEINQTASIIGPADRLNSNFQTVLIHSYVMWHRHRRFRECVPVSAFGGGTSIRTVAFTRKEDVLVKRSHRIVSLLLTPLLGISLANTSAAQAPLPSPSKYDPRITFAPLILPDPVNSYRSGSGSPGPSYWQNEADYVMHANLDPAVKVLTNDEVITYTNNSPDNLDCLWIHLEQNTYRKDARSANLGNTGFGRPPRPGQTAARAPTRADNHTEGFVLESVEVGPVAPATKFIKADYIIDDTRMQIRLTTPLKPHGAQLRIHIKYHYAIPGVWGGRTSW